jgi:hypothetical protein
MSVLSNTEQKIVGQVKDLSGAAKREAAKALGFIHRFQWTVLVGGIIIGQAVFYFFGL